MDKEEGEQRFEGNHSAEGSGSAFESVQSTTKTEAPNQTGDQRLGAPFDEASVFAHTLHVLRRLPINRYRECTEVGDPQFSTVKKMPFGMHKGLPLTDLPPEYIERMCLEPNFFEGSLTKARLLADLQCAGLVVVEVDGFVLPHPQTTVMKFGKYRGKLLSEIPGEYFRSEYLLEDPGLTNENGLSQRLLRRQLSWLATMEESCSASVSSELLSVTPSTWASHSAAMELKSQVEVLSSMVKDIVTTRNGSVPGGPSS